jgi:hypothetical protein
MTTKKTGLKIEKVTYARLCKTAQYENERVEATAIVQDGQDPAEVHDALKAWVETRLGLDISEEDVEKMRRVVERFDSRKWSR